MIILCDNDSGVSKIKKVVRDVAQKSLGKGPFTHVTRNLYVVPTPLLNGLTESKMEDFFDATIKATVIDGKTLSTKNNFDTTKYYGKNVFAHSVVRPKADTINFDGFRPLLSNLTAVIRSHEAAAASSELAAETDHSD